MLRRSFRWPLRNRLAVAAFIPESMLNILADCLAAVGRSPDSATIAACYQAKTSMSAAQVVASATISAAKYTLLAGALAAFGGMSAIFAQRMSGKAAERADKTSRAEHRRRMASAYIAEITSLRDYFDKVGLVSTLQRNAKDQSRFYFHPGYDWLQVYRHDPQSVGVFHEDVASKLVSYCCRMLNELGRLRWLHELTSSQISVIGGPNALSKIYDESAETLIAIHNLADDVVAGLSPLSDPIISATHRRFAGFFDRLKNS